MLIDLKCIKYNSYVNYIIKEEEDISNMFQYISIGTIYLYAIKIKMVSI